MRMPLISQLLFTLSAIGLAVGHTLSLLLALLTIFFAWRKTSDQREAVLATAGFAQLNLPEVKCQSASKCQPVGSCPSSHLSSISQLICNCSQAVPAQSVHFIGRHYNCL
jgi:hypothetical protein